MATLRALLLSTALAAALLAGCSSSPSGPSPSGSGPNGRLTTTGAGASMSMSMSGSAAMDPRCSEPAEEGMVEMYDDCFAGGNRTVPVGSTLMFMNEGARNHTVTIHWVGDPVTTTKVDQKLEPGHDLNFTFASAGTYHVWCKYHGQMTRGMAMVVTAQ